MSNILVTGGAGFVGAYVTKALLQTGHRVVVFDAQPSMNTLGMLLGEDKKNMLTIVAGDITDTWQLLRLCREHKIDGIVHLASPLTKDVNENPSRGIRNICQGTQTILEVAELASIPRVIWASSVAVFGSNKHYPAGPIADSAHHAPEALYGSCKSLCEHAARLAWEKSGVDSVGLRLSVVYGAGRLRGYMSFPSHILRDAALGNPISVPYLDQRLHWQYVEEVADSVLHVLGSKIAGEGRTYNISGDSRTWSEALKIVSRLKPELQITSNPGEDPLLADTRFEFDASGFTDRFGYKPTWPLERGVELTMKTYVEMRAR